MEQLTIQNYAVNFETWKGTNATNRGDAKSNPVLYCPELNDFEIADVCLSPTSRQVRHLIVGGGGLWHKGGPNQIKEWLDRTSGKKIAWGVGHNEHTVGAPTYQFADEFDLFGVRDWGYEHLATNGVWVPCASCLDPVFDTIVSAENAAHEVGAIIHPWESFKTSVQSVSNFDSFETIIRHISQHRVILTNSYHGMYWSTLAGRKVIVINPFSTRFFHFKWRPVFSTPENWRRAVDAAVQYPEALGEARERNGQFLRSVENLIR